VGIDSEQGSLLDVWYSIAPFDQPSWNQYSGSQRAGEREGWQLTIYLPHGVATRESTHAYLWGKKKICHLAAGGKIRSIYVAFGRMRRKSGSIVVVVCGRSAGLVSYVS